ncbi:MAG: hypothetical protein IIT98_01000 [Kiritimatiellae bacterium]|nr:hypothetical protein [Kiritimatiellia bacterium]
MTDFVAIDFETTAYTGDGRNDPWQLGAAVVKAGEIVETREWFFGTAQTPDFEPIMDQWDDFHPVLAGRPLAAHNTACEKTILTRLAPLEPWGPWIDTLRIAKKRLPGLPSYTLGELCAALGCVPEIQGRTWHDGLYDAVACAMLALRLGA